MLVTVVVAGLVSASIAVNLALHRAKLTKERLALLLCGYAPLLAGVFVAGSVLTGGESLLPLFAAVGAGLGHLLAQCGHGRTALLIQCLSVVAVAISALLFIHDEAPARGVLVLCSVSLVELGVVAPVDLRVL